MPDPEEWWKIISEINECHRMSSSLLLLNPEADYRNFGKNLKKKPTNKQKKPQRISTKFGVKNKGGRRVKASKKQYFW